MKTITLQNDQLWIPVWTKGEKRLLTFSINGDKIGEFMIPYKEDCTFSYFAPLSLKEYNGKQIQITGEFPDSFYDTIRETEDTQITDKICKEKRPIAHFTANIGWINDPNGLVYENGTYHLYFQYNPFDTEWENMSWGHAVSKDLIHWEQKETVMYPDETGMMFSGCGLVNEQGLLELEPSTLLFFYSAAGSSNVWSAEKEFTQRIAYSQNHGASLIKTDRGLLPTIKKENRDPKIFFHKETDAYIMVLWLEGNSFTILRSKDLEQWESTQTLELTDAWECPDLFLLSVEGGGQKWVFWSADGFYYVGDFDGYKFTQEMPRKEAYITKLPYAAQTYWGTTDRTVTVPWLRTANKGKSYRGAMGIPRELSLVREEVNGTDTYVLKQSLIREWDQQKNLVVEGKPEADSLSSMKKGFYDGVDNAAYELKTVSEKSSNITWNLYGNEIMYNKETGQLSFLEEQFMLGASISSFDLILDQSIVEITNGEGTIYAVLELEEGNNNRMEISGENLDEFYIYEVR